MLAKRLQTVIHTIISDSQTGFIPGRRIADNIILAHELVKAYTRKNISHRSMLKIDLLKAYDYVKWRYLEQVMTELGFPDRFTHWIMTCVTTISYLTVVNGNASQAFEAAKGLRKRDPISPFLFAIAMEYLSRSLNGLKDDKNYKFHPKCSKMEITHLSFADDLLIFSRGDLESITALQKCFSNFSQASRLQANAAKSSIYFGGVLPVIKQQILQELGYSVGKLPFKYLGIPLSSKKLSLLQWYPLVERIMARINSWTTRKLSYAGRSQLVQTVLSGVQSY